MLFNSLQFAVFFIIVYSLYLVLNHKWQNRMLLTASCVFYGAWDWRFLLLMFVSITTDYFCALKIQESVEEKTRKRFLFLSIFINLAILGFFKYFNFFAVSMDNLFSHFGFSIQPHLLHIILPVGISFYTFQALSYTIDVYRKELEPTRNFRDYALFVTYFPQLVAGPIMRARDLLPQVLSARKLSLKQFYEGCYLIFWGLFQKIFIADNLAKIVDSVFNSSGPYNAAKVLIALYAFAFQIYCDFAGYSNIARGMGKCMGFDIMINFNLPYFAVNPSDFWRRWHISLSTWLRDYLYIPLGGNKKGGFLTYRNLAITMLLGGLWHGAAWTFVIWGAYHGMLLIIHRLLKPVLAKIPSPKNATIGKAWFFLRVVFFFQLTCVGWLIFRAKSIGQILNMLGSFVSNFNVGLDMGFFSLIRLIWLLILVQIAQFIKNDQMVVYKSNILLKAVFYIIFFYSIVMYGASGGKEFIYFQF
ncbi:MAG TPA: membrane-bound O-acyltransferase family protein [Candidatus Omnitrophica bacterium]|nr:membrane-bound O-acyltransferase family protein [Candidatus Omnitrophota bacterium]